MQIKKKVCLFLLILLASCSNKPKTEEEQYAELIEGFKYRTYSRLSESSLPMIIGEINRQARDQAEKIPVSAKVAETIKKTDELDMETAHGALALLWLMQMKPDFGIAEVNISLRQVKGEENKYVSTALLGLGMYQNGWRALALKTTTQARAALTGKNSAEQVYEKEVIFYLSLGLLAMQEKDYKTATVAFSGLGSITGITWLSEAAEALFLIQDGKPQAGLSRLKKLSQNPGLPERERQAVTALLNQVESQAGDVDSPLFWPRLLGRVVMTRIMETDTSRLKDLFERLEKFRSSAA